uniref:Si:ch73-359m17.2 n=1 Tax=Sinocyclocheilus grahami TaxID=75366 RepID=A0A672JYL9_SINGR
RMAIRVILVLTLFTGLCFANLKGNLDLNARVVQSSLLHIGGVAERAVDGNRDADYGKGSCTHTKAELNPWWRADLGNVYSISKVAITNRGDCCKERLRGAQIRIGNKLENDGNNNELLETIQMFYHLPMFMMLELSSTYIYPTLAAAQNAVDGNRESVYALGSCSLTLWNTNPWWRVDLLDVYRVTRVSITNRGDCCEKTVEGIQIRIGNSLENNGNNNELAAIVGPIPLGNTKTFEFKPIKGRYVNLILPGRNEPLTLCEVEVYSGER